MVVGRLSSAGWAEPSVLLVGGLLVLALALYVASRGGVGRVPMLAALAMFALSIYLYGQALGGLASELPIWATWLARTWVGAALGPPLWLLLTLALVAEEGGERLRGGLTRLYWPIAVAVLTIGIAFAIGGTTTELVERWGAAEELSPQLGLLSGPVRHVPDGLLFGPFRVYALLCLAWATINVGWLWVRSEHSTPVRPRFGWLLLSTVMFSFGSGVLAIASSALAVPGILGQLVLIVGMLVMGWNVARYGALTSGEVVSVDFVVFGLAMFLIAAVYGGVTLLLAPLDYSWFERALVVLPVAMITHVLINARGHFVDRIMYGPVVSRLRARLSELATGVGLQSDAVAAAAQVVTSVDQLMVDAQRDLRKEALPRTDSSAAPRDSMTAFAVDLEPLVSSALRRLNDLPALSRHPLLAALGDFVSAPTALDRAVKLRGELMQAIERLRPPDEAPPKRGLGAGAGSWTHYVVLREAYVDGLPNRDIMQRYWIGEGSFYRAREAAIKTIAMDLAQRAGGHVLQY